MSKITAAQLETILKSARGPRPQVYVETGTYRAEQFAVSAPLFPRAIAVELDPRFAEMAKQAAPGATVICGDTRVHLPKLAREITEPVFFYLDAHFCKTNPPIKQSPFPLWDELRALRARPYADIVLIDDVHTFGKKRPELRYRGAPDWEKVTTASISAFLGAKGFQVGDGFVVCRG